MRFLPLALLALGLPAAAFAQHAGHGGGGGSAGVESPRKRASDEHPTLPAGLLPLGSPRAIEVLVVYYGFSPAEIRAEQGEEVVLRVRRSDDAHCREGLSIPSREMVVQLPLGENVTISLKLERAETIALTCAGDDSHASIVVAPRPGKP